jgi:hypothetical protein
MMTLACSLINMHKEKQRKQNQQLLLLLQSLPYRRSSCIKQVSETTKEGAAPHKSLITRKRESAAIRQKQSAHIKKDSACITKAGKPPTFCGSSPINRAKVAAVPHETATQQKRSARITRETAKWLKRYNELVEYKRETGNSNVPKKYKSNPQLGTWVNTQRGAFRRESLAKDRNAMLNEIGFEWRLGPTPILCSWKTRYYELVEYKRDFGDCNVSGRYKPNPQLGTWVRWQRNQFKNKSLSKERIRKLNEIGFAWEILKDTWIKHYSAV